MHGLILGLILALGSPAALAEEPVLRLAYTDQESPFFVMGNGRDIPAMPGIAVEIAKSAAKTCGVALRPERFTGGRLLALLEDNAVDSALMLSFAPERLRIAVYPMAGDAADPALQLATPSYAFYVRKGSAVSWDGRALNGALRPVGANLGWSIVNDLRNAGIAVETAQDTRNNFNKLLGARIDAFAIQSSIGDPYLERNGIDDRAARLEPPISSKPYFQVFSHAWHQAHPDAAACLWREAAALRERDMPALLSRYHDSM